MIRSRDCDSRSNSASWLREKLPWRLVEGALGLLLVSLFLFVCVAMYAGQSQWKCPDCLDFFDEPVNASRRAQPVGNETGLSHILFGLGGSAQSWRTRRQYSELWWSSGHTRGFVWLDSPPNYTWSAAGPPYRVSEDSSRFPYSSGSGTRSAVRLARIVLESVRLRAPGVRWYVMGDDDTVFFTENLVAVLGKYDHEEMYYVGGVSESVEQDVMHSYGMAFGGGGFAISYVLAEELARLLDGCLGRYGYFYGSDQRVAACVAELGVPLTREPGFHQLDVRGDAYGLLAAHPVAPLVSLHHLDYVDPLVPGRTQLEALRAIMLAAALDPGRALQQTFGYDRGRNWTVSVSWGYTAQLYPRVIPAHDLGRAVQTFKTWRSWQPGPFTINTRPWSADPCEQPLVFFLDGAFGVDAPRGNLTLSVYKRRSPSGRPCGRPEYREALKVDNIEVLAPMMGTGEWKKGPRRYCTVIDREKKRGSMVVKIRKCRRGESTSPP